MDKGGTETFEQKEKKIDDNAQGFISERRYRLYVSRKEGQRELTSAEDCMNASIRGLENYI